MIDALPFLCLATFFFTGWTSAENWLRRDASLSRAERWAAAATFVLFVWALLLIGLGFLGQFAYLPIIGAIAVLSTAAAAIGVRHPHPRPIGEPSLGQVLRSIHPFAWGIFALAALAMAKQLWLGWVLPIQFFDDLHYHVPIAVNTVHDAGFRELPGASFYVNNFPRLGELWQALALLAFGGLRAVDLVQWPFAWLTALAVYGLARRLGAGPSAALAGAALPMLTPLVLYQSMSAYVDLQVHGWIVLAAAAVIGGRAEPDQTISPGRILWFFAACGLGVSTKYNAIYAAVVLGFVALWYWGGRSMFSGGRWRVTLLAALLSLVVGTPWMVRNWVNHGSPTYPFYVELFGTMVFEAPYDPSDIGEAKPWGEMPFADKWLGAWIGLDWDTWTRFGLVGIEATENDREELFDPARAMTPDRRDTGFGLVWIVVILPGLLAGYMASRLLAGMPPGRRRAWVALLLAVVLIFWLSPSSWKPRFALFTIWLGAAGAAAFWPMVARRRSLARILAGAVLLACLFDAYLGIWLNREAAKKHLWLDSGRRLPVASAEWFSWASPDNAFYEAYAEMVRLAGPGEHVAVYSPGTVTLTGYLYDAAGSYRVWPIGTEIEGPELAREEFLAQIEESGAQWVFLTKTFESQIGQRWIRRERRAKRVFENEAAEIWSFRTE
ncbi:MAG: phospholipid carrier-dependent glycosyltransferase [Sumerlaeia bacterium]